MKRRQLLAVGCAQCTGLWAGAAFAQRTPPSEWAAPERFAKPDVTTDEGGLWAMMDREETKLRRSPFAMRDAKLRDYLQGIACKLGGNHCPDVRVYPVRTPHFNASMAPNGMMQVWSGLLLRVDNEAQLASVLGHEIGHYMRRHTLERLRDVKARAAFMTFLAAFGAVGAIGQLATMAGAMSFSRDQERDADSIGITLMREAGYDPREASKVWDNLRAELAGAPGGDPTKNSVFFATHPPSVERSETLARLAENASGGFKGDAELTDQLAGFQFDLLEDEMKRGQYGETVLLLNRMVARSPQRADLLYFRGETRRLRDKDSDLNDALTDLRAAIALDKPPAQAHRSLGFVHQKMNQKSEAQAEFSRYVELLPQAPDVELIRSYITESKS